MRTVCKVDVKKPAKEQPTPVHNRWHPDIPSVATVEPGEVFKVECLDWTGGQVGNNDSADDIHNVDLTQVHLIDPQRPCCVFSAKAAHVHYLSGPIDVTGAQPGDLLVVEICEIQPLPVLIAQQQHCNDSANARTVYGKRNAVTVRLRCSPHGTLLWPALC
eukprot:3002-Heterococcus_DN1.PRE.4